MDSEAAAPHIYVVGGLGGRRNALMRALQGREIETGVNSIATHLLPHYRREGLRLPEAEAAYGGLLTSPLHCALADRDVDLIVDAIRAFLQETDGPDGHA